LNVCFLRDRKFVKEKTKKLGWNSIDDTSVRHRDLINNYQQNTHPQGFPSVTVIDTALMNAVQKDLTKDGKKGRVG
jgi:hypothetical protein